VQQLVVRVVLADHQISGRVVATITVNVVNSGLGRKPIAKRALYDGAVLRPGLTTKPNADIPLAADPSVMPEGVAERLPANTAALGV
jgi:hypothetical protein